MRSVLRMHVQARCLVVVIMLGLASRLAACDTSMPHCCRGDVCDYPPDENGRCAGPSAIPGVGDKLDAGSDTDGD